MIETNSRRGISRRVFISAVIGLGAVTPSSRELESRKPELAGISRTPIYIRLFDGEKNLDVYKFPIERPQARIDSTASARHRMFVVEFAGIYEGPEGGLWIRLKDFVENGKNRSDAYILLKQSSHIKTPENKGIEFIEVKKRPLFDEEYFVHPSTEGALQEDDIGRIIKVDNWEELI